MLNRIVSLILVLLIASCNSPKLGSDPYSTGSNNNGGPLRGFLAEGKLEAMKMLVTFDEQAIKAAIGFPAKPEVVRFLADHHEAMVLAIHEVKYSVPEEETKQKFCGLAKNAELKLKNGMLRLQSGEIVFSSSKCGMILSSQIAAQTWIHEATHLFESILPKYGVRNQVEEEQFADDVAMTVKRSSQSMHFLSAKSVISGLPAVNKSEALKNWQASCTNFEKGIRALTDAKSIESFTCGKAEPDTWRGQHFVFSRPELNLRLLHHISPTPSGFFMDSFKFGGDVNKVVYNPIRWHKGVDECIEGGKKEKEKYGKDFITVECNGGIPTTWTFGHGLNF